MMKRIIILISIVAFILSCNSKDNGTWISIISKSSIGTSTADIGIIIDFLNKKCSHVASDTLISGMIITNDSIIVNNDFRFGILSKKTDKLTAYTNETEYTFVKLEYDNKLSISTNDLLNKEIKVNESFSFILDKDYYHNGDFGICWNLKIKDKRGEKIKGYWYLKKYLSHNLLIFQYYETEVSIFEIKSKCSENIELKLIAPGTLGLFNDITEYTIIK